MTNPKAWTDYENAACVQLYFSMLDAAVTGRPYNKAALIRTARLSPLEISKLRGNMTGMAPVVIGALQYRSRGSIEAKLMNLTACHQRLDPNATTMSGFGYRPLVNYQAALYDAMKEALGMDSGWTGERFSDATGGHYG